MKKKSLLFVSILISIFDFVPSNAGTVKFKHDSSTCFFVRGGDSGCPENGKSAQNSVPLSMNLRTNLLYDAALLPNIGMELHLGKNISVLAYCGYTRLRIPAKHHHWHIYGGEFEIRKYFGKRGTLAGHHLGIYGHIGFFDVAFNGRGAASERQINGGGISYGYSLPVTERLNIDFTVGLGANRGVLRHYDWSDKIQSHEWLYTDKSSLFSPDRVEVTLVWKIGCGTINMFRKKINNH